MSSFCRENLNVRLWVWLACILGAAPVVVAQTGLPPENDDREDAALAVGTVFTLEADLANATVEPFEVLEPGDLGRTAWWYWRTPTTGIYRVDTAGSTSPMAVTIWELTDSGEYSVLAHSFRRPTRLDTSEIQVVPDSILTFSARAESLYWISVGAAVPQILGDVTPPTVPDPLIAHVTVEILPIPWLNNDTYSRRTRISGTSVSFGGSLLEGTLETNEMRLPGDPVGRTRWWTWTAPGNGSATIRNLGTNGVPVVGIYRRNGAQELVRITHSGTRFGNTCYEYWRGRDAVEWDTVGGQAYEIQVEAYPELILEADHQLQLTFAPAPPNDVLINAEVLAGPDLTLLVNNFAAIRNPADPVIAGRTGEGSVWYKWTAPGPGIVQVGTSLPIRYAEPSFEVLAGGGTFGSVFSSMLTQLTTCSEPFVDLDPLPPFVPAFGLFQTIGVVNGRPQLRAGPSGTNDTRGWVSSGDWYVQMDGLNPTSGETNMNFLFTSPPANDQFGNRIILPSALLRVGGRTFAATPEAGDLSGPRGVWWEWTAPQACMFVLTPQSWVAPTEFRVANLESITGDTIPSDAARSTGAPLVFYAPAGQRMAIYVSTTELFGDNFGFTLDEATGPPITGEFEYHPTDGQLYWVLRWPLTLNLPNRLETSKDLLIWTAVDSSIEVGDGYAYIPLIDEEPVRFFRVRALETQ